MIIIANTLVTVTIKLVLAVLLGSLVGIQRTVAGKMAGMRTYALVSLGAALFIIVSDVAGLYYLDLGAQAFDPLRVASQVVVGIGFLGAGLIIFQEKKLVGLTTAAGLWVAAGLGMAVGYGLYSLAIVTTILMVVVFTAFWYIEHYVKGKLNGEDE